MKKKILSFICSLFMIFAYSPNVFAAQIFDDVNLNANTTKDSITKITYASHQWYVIEDATDYVYLLSADKIFGEKYNLETSTNKYPYSGIAYSSDGSTNYSGSLVQKKLEEIQALDFSNQESLAIKSRTLDQVTDAVAPENQSLWLISKNEYNLLNTGLRKTVNADHYWLRSASGKYVWFVDAAGDAYANWTTPDAGRYGIRPAFYLDKSKIAFYSDASTGKPESVSSQLKTYTVPTSNSYKVNVVDSSMDLKINNLVVFNGEIKFDYSTSNVGEDNYLYVRYKNGNDTYNGVVAHIEKGEGEATVSVPGDVAASATVEFYNIKYNDANLTNYVSEPVVVQNLNEKWVFSNEKVNVSGISPCDKSPEISIVQTNEDAQENKNFTLKENEKYITSYNIESSKEYSIIDGSKIDISFNLGQNYANKSVNIYQDNNGNILEYLNIKVDENGIVSLKVDSVSQFLISETVEKDNNVSDGNVSGENNINNDDSNINNPDTGDNTNIMMYVSSFMFSIGGLMILYYMANKKRHS